jgi:cap2 methyltransferase
MDTVRVVTENHLIMGNQPNFPCQSTYQTQYSGIYSTSENTHAGQRKLLMSEIYFMTNVHIERALANPTLDVDAPFLCIYAGACPCTHLSVLMSMFPNVLFVLVDPAFSEKKNRVRTKTTYENRVVIWGEKFSEHIIDIIHAWIGVRNFKQGSAQFKSIPDTYFPYFTDLYKLVPFDVELREDILFISDIRVNARDETAIESDMDRQAIWFHQIKASYGLLKFRLPYVTEQWGSNWRQHGLMRVYLAGDVYMPIWGPRSTTECRLFVKRNCDVSIYDPIKHECKFAGFNQHDRQMPYFYKNQHFKSFDAAATEIIKTKYANYVDTLIPKKHSSDYIDGLQKCKLIEKM